VAGRAPDLISLVAQQISDTEPGTDSLLQRARESFHQLDLAADRLASARPMVLTARGKAIAARKAELAASAAGASTPQINLTQSATVALRDSAVSGSSALLKLCQRSDDHFLHRLLRARRGAHRWPSAFSGCGTSGQACGCAPSMRRSNACARSASTAGCCWSPTRWSGSPYGPAFTVAGLPDAAGWGVTAALLHVVPYLGMAMLTGLGAAETYLAYGTFGAALGMAAFLVLLSMLVGTVVTAWLQGRAAKMNAAAVFIGVVFWGALWGLWGLLLGPALVVLLKVVAEHTRPGQHLAHLMQG